MKSDVSFCNFIIVGCDSSNVCLRWTTVDEIRCLILNFHHWHWYHSVFVTIVWYLGSLMAQGSCFFCDGVVKTENLDWIFLLDVSLLLRLACGRISIVEYVR